MIVAVNRALVDAPLAERMLGWAILACYMVVGRFDDLCKLRWDGGFYESHDWGLRFFLESARRTSSTAASGSTSPTRLAPTVSPRSLRCGKPASRWAHRGPCYAARRLSTLGGRFRFAIRSSRSRTRGTRGCP